MPYSNNLVGLIEIEEHATLDMPALSNDRSVGESTTVTCLVHADLECLTADLQHELDELLQRILTARRLHGLTSLAS